MIPGDNDYLLASDMTYHQCCHIYPSFAAIVEDMKIYSLSLLDTEVAQVFEIIPCGRQGPVYPTSASADILAMQGVRAAANMLHKIDIVRNNFHCSTYRFPPALEVRMILDSTILK